MSELALRLIAENKKTKDKTLDLGNCGLSELPAEAHECRWVEELILSSEWSEYDLENKKFKNKATQNIGDVNQITYLLLTHLHFPLLNKLIISGNQIADLSPLSTLTDLQFLSFSNNQIADLSPLSALTDLQFLFFSSNQIVDLSPLSALSDLQHLSCSINQIADLSPLSALTDLQKFSCSNNQIIDLSPLKKLIENEIQVKWSNKELKGKGIFVAECPLENPPREIVEQGNEAILNYWNQIKEQKGTVELYEAKLIIVGEGGTGKTTLFEKLKDPEHQVGNTLETIGINIKEGLPFTHPIIQNQVFHANLWDFGGQELQYMTHQFFLSPRALYVLMMDARKELGNLSYWFKIISLLGRDKDDSAEMVQLLLVFNKRGIVAAEWF